MADQTLTTLAEVQEHLRTSPQPVFYLSRTATNLVGVDRWVGGFHFITLSDSWDGAHPRSFAPSDVPSIEPRGNVNIANWLLANSQVQAYIAERTPAGFTPQIVLAMFDEQSERLCEQLGYDLIMPSVELRSRLDSKIATTEIGNAAGAPSVPNILTTITGWGDLRSQAESAGLGSELVIQLPYGDSGRTTYFVASREDYDRVASEIVGSQIKVMRRINHEPLAAEAIITRAGTVVGPVLREITGHSELTRYRGGWSGSETYPSLIDDETRRRIGDLVERFAGRLAEEGYRGILEVSILLDTDTGEIYLGELNPRISGSSPHSNLTPGDTTLPLFAYHVLEFSDVDFVLDLDAIRLERERALEDQVWTTLIIQHPGPGTVQFDEAPRSGRYRIAQGDRLEFIAPDLDWQGLAAEDEVYWIRAVGAGEVCSVGVDLGMMVTRLRAQEDHYALRDSAKALILALQGLYRGTPVSTGRRFWRAGVRRLLGR
jgi:D-alanine-D-alanine ligase-like ATP-grasp enzyme